MAHVVFANVEKASAKAFPSLSGVATLGGIKTKVGISGDTRPLFFYQHDLSADAVIQFREPAVGHALYIQSGSVDVGGKVIESEAAALISHGATVRLRARAPTLMLHFHTPEGSDKRPSRSGGCTHVFNKSEATFFKYTETKDGATHVATGNVYADSGCPTCELWFHMSEVDNGGMVSPPHYHTTDEIIAIVKGSMLVGRRELVPGMALGIDANTVYTFTTGKSGMSFVNFRATDSSVALADNSFPPVNERDLVRDMVNGKKSLKDVYG